MIILTPKADFKFYARDDSNENCDELVVKETWVENVYQIQPGDFHDTGVFIDLGANIGAVSIYAAQLERKVEGKDDLPEIQVIAVEPEPDNLKYLGKNLRANSFAEEGIIPTKPIRVMPVGVHNKAGRATIVVREGNSHLAHRIDGMEVHRLGDKEVEIDLITLQDIFDQNKIRECDVLKCDIEGSEYAVFCTAREETLKRIKYLTMEFDATNQAQFGELVYKLSKVFNLHILGSPERGGYIYGRRY